MRDLPQWFNTYYRVLKCSVTYLTGFAPAVAFALAVIALSLPFYAAASVVNNGVVTLIYGLATLGLTKRLMHREVLQLDIDDSGEVHVSDSNQRWQITADSRLTLWVMWVALRATSKKQSSQRKMLVLNCAKLSEKNKRSLGAWVLKQHIEFRG